MTAIEKVDWFCPKCNSYVSSESVTFEETHQICNTGVILEPLNQNKMKRNILWLMLGVILIIFLSNMPKREKHEPKKIQYGNYERLPDAYYRFK